IRLGDELFELSGAPGQRDHSWGVRDWWSMDWVWSAVHLDDGTHVHAGELRLPAATALGVGYVQSAGGELAELERLSARGRDGAAPGRRVGGSLTVSAPRRGARRARACSRRVGTCSLGTSPGGG